MKFLVDRCAGRRLADRLVYMGGQGHSGMVRLPDVPASRRIALHSEVLTRHTSELEAGAIITIKGGKVRISKSGS